MQHRFFRIGSVPRRHGFRRWLCRCELMASLCLRELGEQLYLLHEQRRYGIESLGCKYNAKFTHWLMRELRRFNENSD